MDGVQGRRGTAVVQEGFEKLQGAPYCVSIKACTPVGEQFPSVAIPQVSVRCFLVHECVLTAARRLGREDLRPATWDRRSFLSGRRHGDLQQRIHVLTGQKKGPQEAACGHIEGTCGGSGVRKKQSEDGAIALPQTRPTDIAVRELKEIPASKILPTCLEENRTRSLHRRVSATYPLHN